MISDDAGTGGDRTPVGVDPLEITAPIPVVAGVHHHEAPPPHHHEGAPGPDVSPPGHHVGTDVVPPARHADDGRRHRGLLAAAGATVAALALVGGLGYAMAERGGQPGAAASDGATSTTSTGGASSGAGGLAANDPTSAAPLPASQPTLVLGDSLGLVVYPWLADDLPDRYVSYAAEVGRSTPKTADALEALGEIPPVVLVSTGTNDQYAADFTAAATRILDTLGPQRCVVWADVVRPDRVGDPQAQMNAALNALVAAHPNVRVLRWSELVAAHPEWMAGDGIHPNQDGAQARATAFAQAAAACSPIDPAAPRAPRQTLPDSVFWGPVSGANHAASGSGVSAGSGGSGSGATAPAAPAPTPSPTASRTTSAPSPTTPTTSSAPPRPSTSSAPPPAPTTEPPPPTSPAPAPTGSPTA